MGGVNCWGPNTDTPVKWRATNRGKLELHSRWKDELQATNGPSHEHATFTGRGRHKGTSSPVQLFVTHRTVTFRYMSAALLSLKNPAVEPTGPFWGERQHSELSALLYQTLQTGHVTHPFHSACVWIQCLLKQTFQQLWPMNKSNLNII